MSKNSVKQAVLTSDDLGMHPAINRGILDALATRRISVTNIMVPCPAAEAAAAEIVRLDLPCGVHLTLTSEWDNMRTQPLTAGAGLRGPDGTQWRTHRELAAAATDEEILGEMRAQIRRAQDWGIRPTHVDIHMIPAGSPSVPEERRVLALAEAAGGEFGLNCTYSGDGSPEDGHKSRHFSSAISTAGRSPADIRRWLEGLGAGLHHLTLHLTDPITRLTDLSDPANPWLQRYRDEDTSLLYGQLPQMLDELGFEILHPEDLPDIYRS